MTLTTVVAFLAEGEAGGRGMISLETLVYWVVYMLIGAVVLGLLWYLIGYVESQGLGPPLMFKVIRVVFIVLVVLLLIGLLLSFVSGKPLFRAGLPTSVAMSLVSN